jgi:hypothetical protein
MDELPFKVLLYRYFFFAWLFKDVNKGNVYERAVAWKHNKSQAKWLPTYMRRWVFLNGIMYAFGAVCEMILQAPLLAAFFFVPMAVGVTVNTVIAALIIGFKSLSGPL